MKNELTLPIFVLTDESSTLINDIDTDQIFHNRYLSIVDIDKMGQYALDNLDGYKDFPTRVKPGMLLVAGENFGSGSSRQQAVDCFKALKNSCILAESYGAIYERNAINAAMPILTYSPEMIAELELEDKDVIRVDFMKGEVTNLKNNKTFSINPFFFTAGVIIPGIEDISPVLPKGDIGFRF